jgi:hypothetical protein
VTVLRLGDPVWARVHPWSTPIKAKVKAFPRAVWVEVEAAEPSETGENEWLLPFSQVTKRRA